MSTAAPTLVLIHGLGATSGVWADLEAELQWPGRVVKPDLPGHGRSPWTGDYTVGAMAGVLSGHFDRGEPILIVGHSLGGGIGICLASGLFRPRVRAVIGLGIKVAWTEDDVALMAGVAARGVRYFDSRAEAVARFLRQAGLDGVAGPDHPAVESAVLEGDGGWRVSQDPLTFAQTPLDMAGLMQAARVPVTLGAGQHDTMVSQSDLASFTDEPRIASGRGHNVQVEDPAWVAELVREAQLQAG